MCGWRRSHLQDPLTSLRATHSLTTVFLIWLEQLVPRPV